MNDQCSCLLVTYQRDQGLVSISCFSVPVCEHQLAGWETTISWQPGGLQYLGPVRRAQKLEGMQHQGQGGWQPRPTNNASSVAQEPHTSPQPPFFSSLTHPSAWAWKPHLAGQRFLPSLQRQLAGGSSTSTGGTLRPSTCLACDTWSLCHLHCCEHPGKLIKTPVLRWETFFLWLPCVHSIAPLYHAIALFPAMPLSICTLLVPMACRGHGTARFKLTFPCPRDKCPSSTNNWLALSLIYFAHSKDSL
jgi:hypothetical protein